MTARTTIIAGSLFMAFAVAFGAFGAHIVQDMLMPGRFEVYNTGVDYHFYHALGLLVLGILSMKAPGNRWFSWSGYCLITGILIFSGSLYILTLTDTGWLGAVTPIGGVAFILGWLFLAVGIFNSQITSNEESQ